MSHLKVAAALWLSLVVLLCGTAIYSIPLAIVASIVLSVLITVAAVYVLFRRKRPATVRGI